MTRTAIWSFLSTAVLTGMATAQPPAWHWAKSGADVGESSGNGIAVDVSGNVYVAGTFTGTFDLGSISLLSAGGKDIFIAKYTHDGQLLWAESVGSVTDDESTGVALDGGGNIYVTGSFTGTAAFGTATLSSDGENDIFLAKYNNNGDLQWVKKAGGQYADQGMALYISNNNILLTGRFSGYGGSPAVYGTASFGSFIITSKGNTDMFLAKYSTDGDVIWVNNAGAYSSEIGYGITSDLFGNVYVAGRFNGSYTWFDTVKLNSNSSGFIVGDMFLAKYDSNGMLTWVKGAGGKNAGSSAGGSVGAISVAVDDLGNAFVTGFFHGCDMNFGSAILQNLGDADIFLAKYDPSGNLTWAKNAGGLSGEGGKDITIDNHGDVYIAGDYSYQAAFGNNTLQGYGGPDVFVAKYDKDGNPKWAQRAGGTGYDMGTAIAIDPSGHIFLTGRYGSQPAAFGQHSISAMNDFDMFVAKLEQFPQDVPDIINENSVTIYPNPATDRIVIECKQEYARFQVYNMMGQCIADEKISDDIVFVNTATWVAGTYQLQLTDVNGNRINKKLIKQ